MPLPSTSWISTPNKSDHFTSGYTSKILFNFHYTEGVEVANKADIFKEITSTFGDNFKGSNILPKKYFNKIDDGRCFRITMYFYKKLDGENLDITQFIVDIDDAVKYPIAASIAPTGTTNIGIFTLCKYEVYINEYLASGVPYMSGVGSIFYADSGDGSHLVMAPLIGASDIVSDVNSFALAIQNDCGAAIYVINLMVEEIS